MRKDNKEDQMNTYNFAGSKIINNNDISNLIDEEIQSDSDTDVNENSKESNNAVKKRKYKIDTDNESDISNEQDKNNAEKEKKIRIQKTSVVKQRSSSGAIGNIDTGFSGNSNSDDDSNDGSENQIKKVRVRRDKLNSSDKPEDTQYKANITKTKKVNKVKSKVKNQEHGNIKSEANEDNSDQEKHIIYPEHFGFPRIPSMEPAPEGAFAVPEYPTVLPVLPVRDIVIFNYMIVPLVVGREQSISAVNAALSKSKFLFVSAQRDESVEDPGVGDIYKVGTVVMILRALRIPDGRFKLLVQGVDRAKLVEINQENPFIEAVVEPMPEEPGVVRYIEKEALLREVRSQSERILNIRGQSAADIMSILNNISDLSRLADIVAANIQLKVSEAQEVLECSEPLERLKLVNEHLAKEAEVVTVQAKIQNMTREGIDKAHKDYFLREQIKAIKRELGNDEEEENELEALTEVLNKAGLPTDVKQEIDKQLKRLSMLHQDSSEAAILRTYLELVSELPWQEISKDSLDILRAEKILNEDHFGLPKVKDRILEYLSVRKLNPESRGAILCFVGPPGVGKTSLGRSIARALGRKFQRMSLGGMRDEAEIRGHRRTYVGAMPGRIIQSLKQARTRNPLIMLDEIDKLGTDFRGDPASALLEVLDPEQNFSFTDYYLNLPFDLSKVMFICTANALDTIPSPLLDRMEVIRIPGYTMQEKIIIAKRYLIPRQAEENGLISFSKKENGENINEEDSVQVQEIKQIRKNKSSADGKKVKNWFSESVLNSIIEGYTREAGLRNLEREIGTICRKLARRKAEGKKEYAEFTVKQIYEFLGAARYQEEEKEVTPLPGLANGLAWTVHGGEVLHVEAGIMKGKGQLTLTGQLGEVMKESAKAAVSYIRSHAEQLGIDSDFAEQKDIHIHVPAGATPKDGPSAGVTLTISLISVLLGKSVSSGCCMTGEITLRGRVLAVGGIKEKILAAVARGLKKVFIPKQNKKDLEEVPKELLAKIKVVLVTDIAEIIHDVFSD